MRLRTRLVLLVGISVAIGIVAVATILTWTSWRAIQTQAQSEGQAIARLLAQSVSVSEQVAADMESVLDQELLAQGVLTSHLADLADQAGLADSTLSRRLAEITARSSIDELWITDATGRLRAASTEDVEPAGTVAAMAGLPPAALDRLVDGIDFAQPLGTGQQALGGLPMRYVGVRGIDAPRAVLVGREQRHLARLAEAQGVPRLLDALLRDGAIEGLWVFGPDGGLVAGGRASRAPADPAALSMIEQTLVQAALRGEPTKAELSRGWISVAAAMPDAYGIPVGVTLARLSVGPFHALLADYLRIGGLVSVGALLAGVGLSVVTGRQMAAPILRIATAATEIDSHRFVLGSLVAVTRRRDELGHLARTFEVMAEKVQEREEELERQVQARTAELQLKNEQLDQARRRLEADLELAKLLQATILPQSFPIDRGWSGSAMMTPALQMAGDFYDYVTLDQNRTGLVIADVSGKGVAPAFFMAVSRAALQDAALRHGDPGHCLAAANDRLCGQNPLDMFVTVFYAIINERDGRVIYANGGHNRPYVIPLEGPPRAVELTGGVALGVMAGLDYDASALVLRPGETLFLYTDGVSEAMNAENEEFGEARLEAVLARVAGQPVEDILRAVTDAVRDFAGAAPQSDDITCLVVRYLGGTVQYAPERGAFA
jgi:sigma-B regulation protein RsbU (phosphoserine phosphatase)